MVFGRKKGFLPSWGSKPEKENDPEFAAKAYKLEVLQKTLEELQENIRLHLASWHTMCDTSAAIANGLAKLAGGGDLNSVTPLMNMAQMYHSAQNTIEGFVMEPVQRVAEDMTLRETAALLSRFPPIRAKIARRRQLLAEVELAGSKVRAAEAAKDRERDSFAAVAGAEHRRRVTAALATAATVANGVTGEVMRDVDLLEKERAAMLVPQVSALVGCQAYFLRRSASVLERLSSNLPHSALALCRLVSPSALETASTSTSTWTSTSTPAAPLLHFSAAGPAGPASAASSGHLPTPLFDCGFVGDPRPAALGSQRTATTASSSPYASYPFSSPPPPPPPPPPRRPSMNGSSSPYPSSGPRLETSLSGRPLPPPPPPPNVAPLPMKTPAAGFVGAGAGAGVATGATAAAIVWPAVGEAGNGGPSWGFEAASFDGDDDIVEEVTWR